MESSKISGDALDGAVAIIFPMIVIHTFYLVYVIYRHFKIHGVMQRVITV